MGMVHTLMFNTAGDGHSVWITAVGMREPRLREVVSSPGWTAIEGQNTELELCFQFLASEFLGSNLEGERWNTITYVIYFREKVFVQKTGTPFSHNLQPKHDESHWLKPEV